MKLLTPEQARQRLRDAIGPGRRFPRAIDLAVAADVPAHLVSMMRTGRKPVCGKVMRLLGLDHARAYRETEA